MKVDKLTNAVESANQIPDSYFGDKQVKWLVHEISKLKPEQINAFKSSIDINSPGIKTVIEKMTEMFKCASKGNAQIMEQYISISKSCLKQLDNKELSDEEREKYFQKAISLADKANEVYWNFWRMAIGFIAIIFGIILILFSSTSSDKDDSNKS